MIERFCLYLVKNTNLNEEQFEIIKFGLESVLSTAFSLLLTFLISWLLGVFKIMLVVLASFAIVKVTAGGAHCKTMLNCALFSSITFTSLAKLIDIFNEFLVANQTIILILTSIIAFTIHYFWSPAQTPEKPMSEKYCKKLRMLSFVTLFITFMALYLMHFAKIAFAFPVVIASCLGIICHSISITPLGFILIDKVDYALSWVLKGGLKYDQN
ncbi:accessory gene regulator ArgB-like protein [Zhaonella formicivorans]|uniref:accessory gene regulator ArgB-like protein n=1 Tax=Zhaonella formicivorans TaxID=2528593 RepID=UPI0010DE298F|nr:accessory gene regulator B family protein [Zhaonella formicivorans]